MKTLKILTAIGVLGLIFVVAYMSLNPTEPIPVYVDSSLSDGVNPEYKIAGYDIGDVATDFNLKNIDHKMVSLSNYPEAKGFIVIFTCNHCPYSVAYEDRIIKIDKKYKAQGYPVIAINPNNPKSYPDESFEHMQKRASDKGFTFPYLVDQGQKIYPQYGATKTPHVFLLKKEAGKNTVKYIGAIDDNHKNENAVKNHFLKNAVDALIKGEPVPLEKTVAIGCSIKV